MTCCNHLVKIGLEEREKRLKEVEDFKAAHLEACQSSQEASVKRVKAFEELKLQVDSVLSSKVCGSMWSLVLTTVTVYGCVECVHIHCIRHVE